jgi:homopolymeric O-antigen transport system permease protein
VEALTDREARASRVEAGDPPVRVVEPATGWRFPDLREVWERRDLFHLMVRRDISVRYRQSAIGGTWAIVQPLLFAIVFSVFFGHLASVPSAPGIPYPVLAVSGMVMWLFITDAISLAANSTISSPNLIERVYFPRVVIPLAAVIPPLVDFAIAFIVVIGAMLVYGTAPSPRILLLPGVLLLAMTVIVGLGLWLSALNVRYRDVQQAVPIAVLLGFFITPIVYPITLIPAIALPFYSLNPAVGILEAYRWVLFSTYDFPGLVLLVPLLAGPVLVVTGLLYFQRMETSFADVI